MRTEILFATALALTGCLSSVRPGPIDASPFVPLDDAQLNAVLGDYPTPGASASNEVRDKNGNAVAFPAERARFADALVAYEPGVPGPIPEGQEPDAALGAPDYTVNIWERPRAVSLGNGGAITLRFTQGELVDGEGPDLFIFEIGASVEGMSVDVSADGRTWVAVGTARGGACSVDIGPYVQPGDSFHYVRIRDVANSGSDSEAWPGADIDAVAIVDAVRRVSLPSEVLFDFDSDTLAGGAPAALDQVIDSIRRRASATIVVEGHTDDVGTEEYNQALSERRAEAVASYLVKRGIPRDRVASRGHGESRPIVANDGDDGRKKNRRVEIVIQER
jgi:outer membrane protein OmpA-like peptidoglycan-associated protein